MRLAIQTNLAGWLRIWLIDRRGQILAQQQRRVAHRASERLLTLVHELLRAQGIRISRLSSILVARGPGSFTAVRTGLIVANTLGWLLGIPVQGKVAKDVLVGRLELHKMSKPESNSQRVVRPWYGREPNITTARP